MKIIFTLRDEEEIYRKVEKRYRTEDAERHVHDILSSLEDTGDDLVRGYALCALTKADFESLAEKFLENYDCTIDENSQWENLINSYVG